MKRLSAFALFASSLCSASHADLLVGGNYPTQTQT